MHLCDVCAKNYTIKKTAGHFFGHCDHCGEQSNLLKVTEYKQKEQHLKEDEYE